jgi:Fe-S-cluster containining protein
MSDVQPEHKESHALHHLRVIYADIDQRVQSITAVRPDWPCRQGCDSCCRQLAQIPELTAAEWHVLQQGFAQLSPPIQQAVAERIRALAAWHEGPVTCPFLDTARGSCLVYAHRPAACRMYGFYVSRTAHWWCDTIQALHEAGVCEALVLGNHGAIERALQHQGGEVKSLREWFRQTVAYDDQRV